MYFSCQNIYVHYIFVSTYVLYLTLRNIQVHRPTFLLLRHKIEKNKYRTTTNQMQIFTHTHK